MSGMLITMLRCTLGPRLLSCSARQPPYAAYQPRRAEVLGDRVCLAVHTSARALFGLPWIALMLVRLLWQLRSRPEGITVFMVVGTSLLVRLGLILIGARLTGQLMRGYGRLHTPAYHRFLSVWSTGRRVEKETSETAPDDYDYEPRPIDYHCARTLSPWPDSSAPHRCVEVADFKLPSGWQGFALRIPGVSALIAAVVARRLIYPGSVWFFQRQLGTVLMQGRGELCAKHGGRRCRLQSKCGDNIDAMLVDRRQSGKNAGKRLIITSEGNASFYEIGNMSPALHSGTDVGGYSVLGWNHPGFAASSGCPTPDSEADAIEAVIEFATKKLGFAAADIVLYGWSIGGFSTSCAAVRHKDIGGVIVDASFDDLVPLAERMMPALLPAWMLSFVTPVLRRHYDLRPGAMLRQYEGPLVIIRRQKDEVIGVGGGSPAHLALNRTNNLLMDVLSSRYARLFSTDGTNFSHIERWLAFDSFMGPAHHSESASSVPKLSQSEASTWIPLLKRHLQDINLNHTTPLPNLDVALNLLEQQRT